LRLNDSLPVILGKNLVGRLELLGDDLGRLASLTHLERLANAEDNLDAELDSSGGLDPNVAGQLAAGHALAQRGGWC